MYKSCIFAQKYSFWEYCHRAKLVIPLKHADRRFQVDECE